MAKTLHPEDPLEIWIHLDDPNASDRKVWAVQYFRRGRWRYTRCFAVHIWQPHLVQGRGTDVAFTPPDQLGRRRQPRFVIRLYGRYEVRMVFGQARLLRRDDPLA